MHNKRNSTSMKLRKIVTQSIELKPTFFKDPSENPGNTVYNSILNLA